MTRSEAKILAEELYKLMKKDIRDIVAQTVTEDSDELLSAGQVANLMGVSVSYVRQRDIPHIKVGRLNRYRKSDIQKMMNR